MKRNVNKSIENTPVYIHSQILLVIYSPNLVIKYSAVNIINLIDIIIPVIHTRYVVIIIKNSLIFILNA